MNTPRKIAVIGNSHAACYKAALDETPALAGDVSYTFFAAIAGLMAAFRATGGRMVATGDKLPAQIARSSGGDSNMDPADYDGFLLVGMSFRMHPFFDARLSGAVRDLALRDRLCGDYGWQLAQDLRSLTDKPIHVAHMPLPAFDDAVFAQGAPGQPLSYADHAALWRPLLSELDLTLLEQPEDTRHRDLMTRRSFARASIRMADGAAHGDDERFHMNPAFGARMLRALQENTAQLAAG